MSGFKYALTFTIGAAVGSVVTWKLLKTKYEQIAQEEIDSVKEVFSRRRNIINDNDSAVDETEGANEDNTDESEYKDAVKNSGYVNYSDMHSIAKKEDKHNMRENSKPYVITPEEFGENSDYECYSLTYYDADEILADEDDELIEDVDNTVGLDSLERFGEHEDDSVFVRNDAMKRDYEILLDRRSYSEVTGNNPYRSED